MVTVIIFVVFGHFVEKHWPESEEENQKYHSFNSTEVGIQILRSLDEGCLLESIDVNVVLNV